MDKDSERQVPVKIEVETQRVDGTIQLSEIIQRVRRRAAARGHRDVDRLAGELVRALQKMEAEEAGPEQGRPPTDSGA